MADTVNMSLTLPVVGSTSGPEYAELNNAAFEEIDVHDHTSGKGVKVPTAGININEDLSFAGFSPTSLESAVFQEVAGTPASRSVYVSSGNLYFKNGSGTAVQITSGSSVAGTPGTISNLGDGGSSAVFSDLAEDFSWYFSGTSLAAFNIGDLRLYPFDGINSYTNFIALKSPTVLSSNYSLTLPTALPASTSFVQVSSAGALSFSNTITQPILGPSGSVSAPAYSFSGDTNTGVYSGGSDVLYLVTGGTIAQNIDTTRVFIPLRLNIASGTVGTPGLVFNTDEDTGIYWSGTNTLGISAGGVQRLSIGSSISTNNTSLSVGTGTVSGATGTFTGAVSAASINLSSGGAFKVKFVTIITSLTTTFGAAYFPYTAHGLTGSSIRGVIITKYKPSSGRGYSSGYQGDSVSNGSDGGIGAYWTGTLVGAEFVERSSSGDWDIYATIFYV